MKKIILPRGKGKTTELIKISAETGCYIVCRSPSEASRIQLTATQIGLRIPFPITYEEFITGQYFGKGIKGFLIDDLDKLINEISAVVPVYAVTMTDEKGMEDRRIKSLVEKHLLLSPNPPKDSISYENRSQK